MKNTRKNKSFLKEKSRTLLAFIIIYVLFLFYGAYLALKSDYIKIILETILSPIMIGLIFGFIDSLRRDYNEYYQNLADDYKKGEESD
jgi:amino acid permease